MPDGTVDSALPDGTVPDVTIDGSPDANTGATAASGLATLLGVTGYDVEAGDGVTSDFRVTLRGRDGANFGVIDVFADPDSFSGTIASPDGVLANRSRVALSGDHLFMKTSFGTAAVRLRIEARKVPAPT